MVADYLSEIDCDSSNLNEEISGKLNCLTETDSSEDNQFSFENASKDGELKSFKGIRIRHITLVDYGHVAMSNPVWQFLYTLDDCLNGGQLKAITAAKNLKCIFPGVEAEDISMANSMLGHSVVQDEIEDIFKDCLHLKNLIASHDFVFLLTDTRESRRLPTLLCADAIKVAITAALGFDTFLVMRHGAGQVLPSTNSSPACSDDETNSPQIEYDAPSELMDLSIFLETCIGKLT